MSNHTDGSIERPASIAGLATPEQISSPFRRASDDRCEKRPSIRWQWFSANCLAAFVPALVSVAYAASGWIALFDGKTLDNWIVRGGTAQYRIEGEMIVGTTVDSRDPGTQTFLCTRREYADFELELDVLCDKALNSGIQIRSHVYERDTPTPKRPRHKGEVYGYQCEIANSERCTSGNFQDEARGYIWYDDLKKRPDACGAFKDDQWNHYRIVAQGDRIRSWVNGVACADFRDRKDASGLIGLQVHTVKFGTGPFQVRFKNIRLRELTAGDQAGVD